MTRWTPAPAPDDTPDDMLLLKGGMTQLVACFLPRPGQNMPPGGMFLRSSNRAKTTFLNRYHHITIPSSPTENHFWPPSQKPQGWSFLVHFWPKIKQKKTFVPLLPLRQKSYRAKNGFVEDHFSRRICQWRSKIHSSSKTRDSWKKNDVKKNRKKTEYRWSHVWSENHFKNTNCLVYPSPRLVEKK